MNNSQNKYEEEVSIFSLLWYCVSRWKSIVAVALIGLILGCGVAVVKAPAAGTQNADISEPSSKYQITEDLKLFCEDRMDSLQKYVEETRLLEFDAYDLYRGAVSYKIDAPQVDLEAVYGALYSYIYNGALYAELEEETGLYNVNDLSKLVGCSVHGLENITVLSETTLGQMTFTVTILGQTPEEATQLLGQIEESVNAYLNKIQNVYAIANYSAYETSVSKGMSTDLVDYQDKIRTKYTSEKEILNNYTAVLEEMAGEDSGEQVAVEGFSKETMLKYGGLGFIVGAVLAIIVWAVIYLFGTRLYAVTSLEDRLNIKILGSICDTQRLNMIDRWIAQKRGGVYSALSIEEQRNIILLNVKNELKKHDTVKKVFLVSSQGSAVPEADLLKAGLEAAGYKVHGCENVIGRADIMEQMLPNDAVVVLENKETSKVSLVEAEISTLKDYVENVLGMIVIGNRK